MNNRIKISLYILIVVVVSSCKNDTVTPPHISNITSISGRTMGTTYLISYVEKSNKNFKKEIDSILIAINQSVSTYIPSSTISQINQDSLWESVEIYQNGSYNSFRKLSVENDSHFVKNYIAAQDVYRLTQGFFDPTVMPLVNYWGFGYEAKRPITKVDSQKVNELIQVVGLDKWSENISDSHIELIKPDGSQIDFSAIAKGYGVDVISQYLDDNKIDNYLVEIGGEVYSKGYKSPGTQWVVALSKPKKEAAINQIQEALSVNGRGIASSGNYRNFYEVDGKIYGHEINPNNGYPEMNDLLGVTVIADNCMLADAYATAFMIMGKEKAENAAEKLGRIEAVFFYSDNQGNIVKSLSSGFNQYLHEKK